MPVRPEPVEIGIPDDVDQAGQSGDLVDAVNPPAEQPTEHIEQPAAEVPATADHLAPPNAHPSGNECASEGSERNKEFEEPIASAEDVSSAGIGQDGAAKGRKGKAARKIKSDSAVEGDLGSASETAATTETGSLSPDTEVHGLSLIHI